jgi:hypothetical protein
VIHGCAIPRVGLVPDTLFVEWMELHCTALPAWSPGRRDVMESHPIKRSGTLHVPTVSMSILMSRRVMTGLDLTGVGRLGGVDNLILKADLEIGFV